MWGTVQCRVVEGGSCPSLHGRERQDRGRMCVGRVPLQVGRMVVCGGRYQCEQVCVWCAEKEKQVVETGRCVTAECGRTVVK